MLLPRILTAIVGIPLIIVSIHLGSIVYMAFVFAIILLCLYEYGLILYTGKKPINITAFIIFSLIMSVAVVISTYKTNSYMPDNFLSFIIAITIFGVLFIEIISPKKSLDKVVYTFFGIFLIPWTLAHLISIRNETNGEFLTIAMFVSIWACDSFAYFIGKAIGKHKLNKEVSPKKSWEGSIAGFVFAIISFTVLKNLLMPDFCSNLQAVLLGAIIGSISQVSDLAQSLIKRACNTKDSSNLLPGHGGVLDRFDSLLLLAPIYYYVVILIA